LPCFGSEQSTGAVFSCVAYKFFSEWRGTVEKTLVKLITIAANDLDVAKLEESHYAFIKTSSGRRKRVSLDYGILVEAKLLRIGDTLIKKRGTFGYRIEPKEVSPDG
jgi:hypothetical protein